MILTTFLLLAGITTRADASFSTLTLRKQDAAKIHRDELIQTFHHKARNLANSTSDGAFGDEDICTYVEQAMSFEEVQDGVKGDCTCTGSVTDTLELTCAFANICGEQEDFCGSVDFTIKMSNLVDANGNMQENPSLEISACVDVDADWIKEICTKLNYSGIDFIAPTTCEVTYDAQQCQCDIETMPLDTVMDIEVPCVIWNCSQVVPEALKPYMQENTCDVLTDSEMSSGGAVQPAMSSLTTLESIPPEVVSELSAATSAPTGGSAPAATSAAFSNNVFVNYAVVVLVAVGSLLA